MTCRLPVPAWWQKYVAGRLTTPQDVYREAHAENPDPAQASDRFFDTPDPGPVWDAPERLKAPSHFTTEAYQRQVRRADWTHADPRLVVWAGVFQDMARKRDIPLYVHSCLRGKAEQERLKAAGNSNAAYGRSAHNIGEAVDIVHGVFHWDMNKDEWALLHTLGRLALDRTNSYLKAQHRLSLTWGGDFKSLYDPAHWEITDFRARLRPLPEPEQPTEWTPYSTHTKRDLLLFGLS